MKKIIVLFLLFVLCVQLAQAMNVNSVMAEDISPGREGRIEIEIENTLNDNVEDVLLSLNFAGLPIIPVGSSSESLDELDEGDEENFIFNVRAANDIVPGDYQIPYILSYRIDGQSQTPRTGSIGVTITAQPELEYSIDAENPVIGGQGKINFKIVNRGLADARFVSVNLAQSGFTIVSEKEVYIGTVDSDDFETASFDVVFSGNKPRFVATVRYTDFDNNKKVDEVSLPLDIYTREKAIELGIVKRNNWPIYIIVIVLVIVAWLVWRAIRKRQRMKKSLGH